MTIAESCDRIEDRMIEYTGAWMPVGRNMPEKETELCRELQLQN